VLYENGVILPPIANQSPKAILLNITTMELNLAADLITILSLNLHSYAPGVRFIISFYGFVGGNLVATTIILILAVRIWRKV
jgi:hypothetical protein